MKVCQKDMKLWVYMGVLFVCHYRILARSLSSLEGVLLLHMQLYNKCIYLNCTSLGVIDLIQE